MFRKILFLALFSVASIGAFAQNVDAFKYQAVLRSGGTQVISNQNVSLRFSIREGGPNGPEVYSEEHNVVTNAIGLVNLNVGNGQNVLGDLRTLDWGTNRYFVRTELDASGGNNYAFLGVSELLAVPYAFKAGDVVQKQDLERTGDSIRVTDNPNATWLDMGDLRDNTDDQSLRLQNGLVILSRELTEDTADLNPYVSARLNQFGLDSVLDVNGEAAGQDIQNLGNLGIGTTPGFTLHMVDTVDQISAAPSQSAYFEIAGGNTAGRIRNGIYTEMKGTDGTNIAMNGESNESSAGTNIGVFGGGYFGSTGIGVEGWAEGNSNFNIGVEGFARNPTSGSNWGVYGLARRAAGTNRGLYGVLQDTTNRNGVSGFHLQDAAVYGNAAGIGWNPAILGRANNNNPDTNIALMGFALNGIQNYALWTEEGDAMFNDTAIFNYGNIQDGYVLTSDPNGRATWQAPAVQGLDSVLAVGNDAAGQIIQNLDSLGIGGAPQYTLHIIDTVDNTSANYNYSIFGQIQGGTVANRLRSGMYIEIVGTNGENMAIDGTSNGTSSGINTGVGGFAFNSTLWNRGVYASSGAAQSSTGIYAEAEGGTSNYGVYGLARQGTGDQSGVTGRIDSAGTSSGRNWGVNGFVTSESTTSFGNIGVEGAARGTHTGDNVGVYGLADGAGNNLGALFTAGASSVGGISFSIGAESYALQTNSGFNYGLQGIAGNSTNGNRGVVGQLRGTTNRSGVSGYHLADAAIYGFTISTGWSAAVLGRANGSNPSDTNVALLGFAENGATNYALWTEEGDAMFNDTAIFNYGSPQAGYVLTSDANGRATWQATASDSTQLTDADGDTKIQVEESADEDIIRFDIAGTEYFRIDTVSNGGAPTARFLVTNNGNNIIFGENAGNNISNTVGNGVSNIIIGNGSGNGNTDYSNVFIGTNVATSDGTAQNVAIGHQAAQSGLNRSVAVGHGAGSAGGLDFSVAIGFEAAPLVTGSSRSVLIGNRVGFALTSGDDNVMLGAQAGNSLTTGGENVFLGSRTGFNATGSGNVFLGYSAGENEIGSDKLYIANSNTSSPLVYGDFSSDSLRFNGSITADSMYLPNGAVDGYVLTSDANGKASWQENATDTLPIIRDADTSSSIQISNSDVINFVTNSNQRLSLTSNGSFNLTLNDAASNILFRKQLTNLTAGSAYQLAEFRMTNADFKTNSGAYISLSGDDGNSGLVDFARIQWENLSDGTEDEGLLSFWTSDGTAPQRALTIDEAQQVGIGTATPVSELEVVGKISTDSLQVTDGAVNGYVLTSDGTGNATWQAASGGDQDSTRITDADNDTRIEVEQTADDDQISFNLGGTEYFRMDSVRLGVFNSGFSVFIGEDAGRLDDLTNNQGVYVGRRAGYNQTTGLGNVAIGAEALSQNSVTGQQVAIGYQALRSSTTGFGNTAVGASALSNNIGGDRNTALGQTAANSGTGNDNTSLGYSAANRNTAGGANVTIGSQADFFNTGGSRNVIIGRFAGYVGSNHSKSGSVFIGNEAGRNESTSDKLYIDNSSTNEPLIYGDFANDSLRVNGTLFVRDGVVLDTANATNGYVLTSDANGKATWQAASTSAPQDIDSVLSVGSDAGNDSIYNLRMLGMGTSAPTATIDIVDNLDNFNLSIQNSKNTGAGEVKGVFSTVSGAGSSDKFGLYGEAINGTGTNYGVFGEARRSGGIGTAYGIYGKASGGANNWAGYFENGNVLIENNLGIGIGGAPAHALDVAGTALIDKILTDSANVDTLISNLAFIDSLRIGSAYSFPSVAGTGGQVLEYNGAGELVWASAANAEDSTRLADSDNDTRISVEDTTDEDYIRFFVRGTEYLTIDTAGKIGINMVNPTARLCLWDTLVTSGKHVGINSQLTGSGIGLGDTLIANQAYATGDGEVKFGYYSKVSGGAVNTYYGLYNDISGGATNYGSYNKVQSTSDNYGSYTLSRGGFYNVGHFVDVIGSGAGSDATGLEVYADSAQFAWGIYADATAEGLNSEAIGAELYAQGGDINIGAYTEAFGNGLGTDTAFGIYAAASGASLNYAAYLDTGNVFIGDTLIIPTGAQNGFVLTSDANGYATWQASGSSTCPAGMQTYGGTGCIDEAERAAATWFVADSTCASLGYELADYGAWYGATANAVLTDETDDWEWVRNISQNNMMVVGNGGLTNRTFQDPTTTAPYRCTTRID